MAAPVLLLEDDPAVRRYVTMALDGLPIALRMCESVAQASALLEAEAFDMVLTDLTLVDGSALEFAKALLAQGRMPVAVFSAGITPDVEEQLRRAGVWRILHKPVGLKALQSCVMEALSAVRQPAAGTTAPSPLAVDASPQNPSTPFDGNAALLQTFKAQCRQQFPRDVQAGDEALARHDMDALRRTAHNLKSVLRLIGAQDAAELAQALDAQLIRRDLSDVAGRWQALRGALGRI